MHPIVYVFYVSLVVLLHIPLFMERRYWKTPLWLNCVITPFSIFAFSAIMPACWLGIVDAPWWVCLGAPLSVLLAVVIHLSPAGRFLYFFKIRRNDTAYYNGLDGYIPPKNDDEIL